MAPRDGDISFKLGLDIDGLTRSTDQAEDKLTKSFKFIGKASMDLNKRWKKVSDSAEKNNKKLLLSSRNQQRQIQNITESVTMQGAMVKALAKIQATAGAEDIKVTKERIAAYGRWGETVLAAMQKAKDGGMDEVEALGKIKDELKKTSETAKESLKELKMEAFGAGNVAALDAIQQMKDEAEKARADLTSKYLTYRAGGDIGDAFKESLGSLGSKDVAGMAKGLAKGIGASLKGLGAGAARWGAKKQADPAAGAMGKALGQAAQSMGKMGATMASLGPALMGTVGILTMIVKTLLDAESAAKEFNSDLLQGASTAEFLAKAGGDSQQAFTKLESTVEGIRKAATDASENLAWGINKKTHQEFLSTLKAEGVSLDRIGTEAAASGKSVKEFSTEMVHVGVAYSRNFGVSLAEIASFQSDMTRDMGMSIESTTDAFSMMQTAATESTIASNKFFAIMRGMSADLSLFNLRMDDAATTLKLLGKVMSPKNAEAFLKTITSFYKSQDLMSRVKSTLLGGGKDATKGRLQKDVDSRITSIGGQAAKILGGSDPKAQEAAQKDIKDAVKGSPQKMAEVFAKYQDQFAKEGGGALKDAISQANRMQGKLNQNGLISIASALKDASPISAIEQLDATARSAGAKTGMEDLKDVQIAAFTSMAQASDEQLDQAIQTKQGLLQMKTELAARLKDGYTENTVMSKEQKDMLANMGIKVGDGNALEKVNGKDMRGIWESMTDLSQKELAGTVKQEDYAKSQQKLTQTMSGTMEAILDGLMEYLYGITKDIFDVLNEFMTSSGSWYDKIVGVIIEMVKAFLKFGNVIGLILRVIPGMGEVVDKALDGMGDSFAKFLNATPAKEQGKSEEDKVKSEQRALRAKGDPKSMEILKSMRKEGGVGKLIGDKLDEAKGATEANTAKLEADLRKRLTEQGIGPSESQDKMVAEAKKKQGLDLVAPEIKDALATLAGKGGMSGGVGAVPGVIEAMKKAGIGGKETSEISASLAKGGTLTQAIRDAQLSPEQITALTKGMAAGMSQSDLLSAAGGMSVMTGPAAAAGGAPGAPPSAQAKASAPPGATPAPGAAPGAPPATRTGTTVPVMPTAQGPAAPEVKATAATSQETTDNTAAIAEAVATANSTQGEIVKVLMGKTGKGVILGTPKGEGFAKNAIEEPVLKALRQALFEFWIYKEDKVDKEHLKTIADAGGGKLGPEGNLKRLSQWTKQESGFELPGNAAGGMVDRIIRPAPGEGLASVKPGEGIVPKGGGGGTVKVELSFKDGMERFVEAKVIDTAYESKRREKNH